jgi:alkylhydroperoxidase family enzyme
MYGGSAGELNSIFAGDIETEGWSEKERILLSFALKINEHSQRIGPADIESMRSAGWSDAQIAEVIHVTACFATFNRVANAFGLQTQGLLSLLEDGNVSAL